MQRLPAITAPLHASPTTYDATCDSTAAVAYYGYRYYSPKLGRWVKRDPLWERGGLHLYGMCKNNSIGYADTVGKATTPWGPPSGGGAPHPGNPIDFITQPDPWEDWDFELDPEFDPENPIHIPDFSDPQMPFTSPTFGMGYALGGAFEIGYSFGNCCRGNDLFEYEVFTICGGIGVGASVIPGTGRIPIPGINWPSCTPGNRDDNECPPLSLGLPQNRWVKI